MFGNAARGAISQFSWMMALVMSGISSVSFAYQNDITLLNLADNDNLVTQVPKVSLQPKKCVAISKGRDCYIDVRFSFSLPTPKNVCVYSSQQVEPLRCWQQSAQGELQLSLVSAKDIEISLVNSENERVVASDTVVIAWVYQAKRKKRRWRMF